MGSGSQPSEQAFGSSRQVAEFELGDGTRLVPKRDCNPDRLDGDRNHVFSLADVLRTPQPAEPFAGYTRR